MPPSPSRPAAPPAWVGQVVAAVDQELAATTARREATRLGPVRRRLPGASPAQALFEVDLREQSAGLDLDAVQALRLRPPHGGGQEFPVQEVLVQEPERLVVRASADAWQPLELVADGDPARVLVRLRDLLAGLTDPGLAAGLAQGRASGARPAPDARPAAGPPLNRAQMAAFAAAAAPGLHLVWGPPGTGKTRVLAAVLAHLAATGRSALLVSATGLAVDQALLQAAQAVPARPGQFVRVGTPSLEEVAGHDVLPLDRACASRTADARRRREALGRRRAMLLDAPAFQALSQARSRMDGHRFDDAAYQGARRRLEQAAGVAAIGQRLGELRRRSQEAGRARAAAAAELRDADAQAAATAPAVEAYERIDRLQEEIARRADELAVARGALDGLVDALNATYDELFALRRRPPWKRLPDRAAFRRLDDLRQRQTLEVRRRRDLVDRDGQRLLALRRRVPELLALAGPHTREDVQARLEAQTKARQAAEEAGRAEQRLLGQSRAVARDLEQAQRLPPPEDGDEALVRSADELGLPQLSARVRSLEEAAAPQLEELGRLDREDDELAGQLREAAGAVLQEASVVATTLARLVLDHGVGGRRYDHVLVDDAAVAPAPFVVLAASRATRGVTLFGDFLQNGPARRPDGAAGPGHPPPEVGRWLDGDCFGLLGLGDPGRADQVPGCVVLTEQYRFGPTVTELANRTAYGGLLEVAGGRQAGADEVVLVDVAGFADLPEHDHGIGGARTWTAGALAAQALAVRHGGAGAAVGIVAPDEAQQRLIASLVLDAGLGPNVSVGTAPKLQGREFPVVVFDLVEHRPTARLGPGRVAAGRLGGTRRELDGLRLFNVALTRARGRSYLIADRGAVAAAPAGPLAEVRAMLQRRQIEVVPVRELLAGHRCCAEDEVYQLLGDAEGDLWIWDPLVARRAEELLGHLERPARRGGSATLFVRPPLEQHGCPPALLDRFRRAGVTAVGVSLLRRRLVVLDGRRTLLGDLDLRALARRRAAGDLMLLVEGERFARELLRQQLAERLGRCPPCRDHPEAWCYAARRKPRTSGQPRWFWCCPVPDCRQMVPVR